MIESVYPTRYQLPELTAHLVALLERRRAALERWDDAAEASLRQEAATALDEARRQFLEVVDDRAYWERTQAALQTVALPRYFKLARAQHELEARGYGAWRGGDVLSRAIYAAVGLVTAALVWRTAIPDWLEPLPLALFLFGPLIPDVQEGSAKRRYRKALAALVEEMKQEQTDRHAYQPLGVDEAAAGGNDVVGNSTRGSDRARN